MALGQRKLGFGGLASTAAVRARGDFGIIPSPYDIDAERKMRSKTAAKIYERSMRKSLACKLFLKLESFAPNTMTRLRRDEEVTLSVLNRICVALDVNIGDVMEFVSGD